VWVVGVVLVGAVLVLAGVLADVVAMAAVVLVMAMAVVVVVMKRHRGAAAVVTGRLIFHADGGLRWLTRAADVAHVHQDIHIQVRKGLDAHALGCC
jgi:hypothetical protein